MKRRYFTLLILLFVFIFSSSAQRVISTTSGQRLLLANDGSWEYLSELSDELTAQTNSIFLGTSLSAFEAPLEGKYPLNSDQTDIIQKLLQEFRSDEAQLKVNVEVLKMKIINYESMLNDKSLITSKKSIKHQLREFRKEYEEDKTEYAQASQRILETNNLLSGKVSNREELISILQAESLNSVRYESGMGGMSKPESKVKSMSLQNQNESSLDKYAFNVESKKYPRNIEDCVVVFDGYDKELGAMRKEVKSKYFFGFSQPKMKPYFKNEDYLTCKAGLSQVDKKYFLKLEISIKSKDARKSYGMLRANESIRIELIDGSKVYGISVSQDNGSIEPYSGNTIYTGIYEIGKSGINTLKNSYLDNIGVIWSSGFEQYNIYNVDFLMHQIECLESK